MPSSMQVTISLLPVSLSLVHIPRTRLPALAHQVLRQVLHPHPAFLNITSNDIELSIFAEHHILNDFQPIAHRDARRHRTEQVEISYDNWSVLQIDSHSDQLDNSGTRVHDLSAPLAAAGISILYQSSYMSDFIFVKEDRLKEAMDLFEAAGFLLYHSSSDDADLDAPHSPINYYSPSIDAANGPASPDYHPSIHSQSSTKRGAVLTRNDTQENLTSKKSSDDAHDSHTAPASRHASPTSAEVRILPPDLACVGLSDEFGVDHWGLKIVKLVAFPDLIGPQAPASSSSSYAGGAASFGAATYASSGSDASSSSSSSSASSEYASCDSASSSASAFGEEDRYFEDEAKRDTDSASCTSLATTNNEHEDATGHSKGTRASSDGGKVRIARVAPLSPIVPPQSSTQAERPRISISVQTNTEPTSAPSTRKSHRHRHRHQPDVDKSAPQTHPKSKPKSASSKSGTPFFGFTRTPEGSSLTAPTRVLAALFPPEERHMLICGSELDAADKWVERQERRALDVEDGEDASEDDEDEEEEDVDGRDRHDEECEDDRDTGRDREEQNGGLDEQDGGSSNFLDAGASRHRNRHRGRGVSSQRSSWGHSRSRGRRSRSMHGGGSGALKCLQVDLRRFGLDKHGLVNRFSRVLEENGINHMYSSTFKTANLLVDKRDALRAQALLRTC